VSIETSGIFPHWLQSPKASENNFGRSSDLLSLNSLPAFGSGYEFKIIELTAAGLFLIHTGFPFNPEKTSETKITTNIRLYIISNSFICISKHDK
jgi:hypothetical protein